MAETIFMALTVVLLLYVAYISYKTYLVTQVTLAGMVMFLESLEEDEYGETQRLH